MDRLSVLVALASLALGPCAMAAEPSHDAMNHLASAKGCDLCHRAEPATPDPHAMLPHAPSWKDIALRYKGQKGAEQRLTLIVLRGSGDPEDKDRHWHGKVSDAGMLPNAPAIDKEQATQLVHWILSQAR
jgi:cytochrome c